MIGKSMIYKSTSKCTIYSNNISIMMQNLYVKPFSSKMNRRFVVYFIS